MDICQKGQTQNKNESLNNFVWSPCPKRVFCVEARLKTSVCEAIVQFNEGSKGRYYLFKTMNITPGDNAFKGLSRIQKMRIKDKYKKRRQALRQERKTKKKDKFCVPVAFSTKAVVVFDFL